MKKSIVYIRTSTEEQSPELQLRDIYKTFPESEGCEIRQEQKSAYKENSKRPVFDSIVKQIEAGEISDVYVWAWDRIFRDYKKLNSFFALCKKTSTRATTKIHSVQEIMFEQFINLPEPFDTMLMDMMQTLTGYMGQMESQKKSNRIKMAVLKKEGEKTKSVPCVKNDFNSKDWGRPSLMTPEIIEEMKRLKDKGYSYRQLSNMFDYSIGGIHKRLNE